MLTLMLQCLRSASVVRTSAGVLGERVGTAIAGARVLGGSKPGYIVNCVGPNELSEPTNPSSEASELLLITGHSNLYAAYVLT